MIWCILKFKPDIIYERYNLYQPAGVIVARLFKLPLLLEINAPLADERKKYSNLSLPRLASYVENFTWKHAGALLPVSDVLSKIVINNSGVPESRTHVIHNGINKNILSSVFSDKPESHGDTITIGFVGFINKWHRLDLVIEAISEFPTKNIKFICIGEGDIKKDLEDLVIKRNVSDKVEFKGLIDRGEIFHYIKEFDIALQPSVTPYASPLKLFEYMAAGCLIVAPRTDNICEILNDENAILFDMNNERDFTIKLKQCIDNIKSYDSLRINVKETIGIKKFTWQDNASAVIRIANNLLGK